MMPPTMKITPIIVAAKISSPRTKWMTISDIKGVKYIKLVTCAVVFASFSALSQSRNVIPISNNPIYAAPSSPFMPGISIFPENNMAMDTKAEPNTKLRNSLAASSRLSLMLYIQNSDQTRVLLNAKKTPEGLSTLNLKISPRVEMIKTPKKLINIAIMSLVLIFCRSRGIESRTSVIGQTKFNGWACWAGNNVYDLNMTQ